MARFRALSAAHIIAMVMVVTLCYASGIAAKGSDISPTPALEAGAGFSLPVLSALVLSSTLGSLVALFLCIEF
ncbi:hypothetical protein SLEP1_g43005 [Rubroshorea leprosula]|uniref:Uncharacterized protein n=1 Tax=Rubroshorea leprosula TaxID=152421 RepID=A0AAV5LD42_9ROSI|nr:hypothetical protein SLEP1_g43005 [Rubroshorea leprosula]